MFNRLVRIDVNLSSFIVTCLQIEWLCLCGLRFIIKTWHKYSSIFCAMEFSSMFLLWIFHWSFVDIFEVWIRILCTHGWLLSLEIFPYTRYPNATYCLHICLFRVFRPTLELFPYFWTLPLPIMGCKFRPMLGTHFFFSSEDSLACYIYCDTRHPCIMVPLHSQLMPSVWQWSYHFPFLWSRSVTAGWML